MGAAIYVATGAHIYPSQAISTRGKVLASSPIPPPSWGPPPPPAVIDDAALRRHLRSNANLLVVAAVLHVIAAALSWVLLSFAIERSPPVPGLTEILLAFAIVGLISQISFAAIAGAGFAMIPRVGTNVAAWGTGLLVVGIIALIFSIVVFGGIIGLIGGALMAYAGNKVRRPPMLRWIPPSSWMPPSPPSK